MGEKSGNSSCLTAFSLTEKLSHCLTTIIRMADKNDECGSYSTDVFLTESSSDSQTAATTSGYSDLSSTTTDSSLENDNNNNTNVPEIVELFEMFLYRSLPSINGQTIHKIFDLLQSSIKKIVQTPPTFDVVPEDESPKRWFGPLALEIWRRSEEYQFSVVQHIINNEAHNALANELFLENPSLDSFFQQAIDNGSYTKYFEQRNGEYSFKQLDSFIDESDTDESDTDESDTDESDDNEPCEQGNLDAVISPEDKSIPLSTEKSKDDTSEVETNAAKTTTASSKTKGTGEFNKKLTAVLSSLTSILTGDPPEPRISAD